MEWKFDGENLQVREKIPRKITIDIEEKNLTIYYNGNKFLTYNDYNLSKEEMLKLLRYLLSIG